MLPFIVFVVVTGVVFLVLVKPGPGVSPCRACDHTVHFTANRCPGCGIKWPAAARHAIHRWCAIAVMFAFAMGFLFFLGIVREMQARAGSSSGPSLDSSPAYSTRSYSTPSYSPSQAEIESAKALPSLRGYSDEDKEKIIEASARLHAVLKARGKL